MDIFAEGSFSENCILSLAINIYSFSEKLGTAKIWSFSANVTLLSMTARFLACMFLLKLVCISNGSLNDEGPG